MTNLTEKIDELQAQLLLQHNAMMTVLNSLLISSNDNKTLQVSGNATRVSLLANTGDIKTLLTSGNTIANGISLRTDSVSAKLTGINNNLIAINTTSTAIKAATENSAISGNANNSVLTAMFGEDAKRLAELKRIADCGCNDGEPTPTSLECAGDYRKVTVFSGAFANAGTWPILYIDDVNQRTEISGIANISGVNTYGGTTYPNGTYSSNKSNLIRMEVGDVYCIENVGTALFFVAYAQESSNPSMWEYITVQPGESTGLNVLPGANRQTFTILSPVDVSLNADGFKPLLFYSKDTP